MALSRSCLVCGAPVGRDASACHRCGGLAFLVRNGSAEAGAELYLRRLSYAEAERRLDQALHDAFMAGCASVRVVHGKGAGALREMVRRTADKHPLATGWHEALQGQGDAGVTVVALASR